MWTYFCLLCASISLLFISLGSFSNFSRTMSQTPVVVVTTRCQLTARRVVLLRQLIGLLVWLIECGLFHCFHRNVILFSTFVLYWYNSLTVQLHDWQSCLILKSYFACPTVLLRQKFVYLHVTLLFVQQRSQLFTYLLTHGIVWIDMYGSWRWCTRWGGAAFEGRISQKYPFHVFVWELRYHITMKILWLYSR